MNSRISSVAVVALVAAIAACRGSSAHFPERHRAAAETCSTAPRPPGYNNPTDAGKGFSGQCERDSDCTAGKNGRCSAPGHAQSMCTYDACMSDADCGAGKVCECSAYGNSCMTANCKTDADCGGMGCSPTRPESCGNMAGTVGYFCHTKKDECIDDRDCPKKGDESGMCVYTPAGGRWTCNYDTCVG